MKKKEKYDEFAEQNEKYSKDAFLASASAYLSEKQKRHEMSEEERKKNHIQKFGCDLSTLNPATKIGVKVKEVFSGLIAEIREIDEMEGIGLIALNRGEKSQMFHTSQKYFESRLQEGYLEIIKIK
jgi:hypothetical protein